MSDEAKLFTWVENPIVGDQKSQYWCDVCHDYTTDVITIRLSQFKMLDICKTHLSELLEHIEKNGFDR